MRTSAPAKGTGALDGSGPEDQATG